MPYDAKLEIMLDIDDLRELLLPKLQEPELRLPGEQPDDLRLPGDVSPVDQEVVMPKLDLADAAPITHQEIVEVITPEQKPFDQEPALLKELHILIEYSCLRYFHPVRQFLKDCLAEIDGKEGAITDVAPWTKQDKSKLLSLSVHPNYATVQVDNKEVFTTRDYGSLRNCLKEMLAKVPNKYLKINDDLFKQIKQKVLSNEKFVKSQLLEKALLALGDDCLAKDVFDYCVDMTKG